MHFAFFAENAICIFIENAFFCVEKCILHFFCLKMRFAFFAENAFCIFVENAVCVFAKNAFCGRSEMPFYSLKCDLILGFTALR